MHKRPKNSKRWCDEIFQQSKLDIKACRNKWAFENIRDMFWRRLAWNGLPWDKFDFLALDSFLLAKNDWTSKWAYWRGKLTLIRNVGKTQRFV